MKKFLFSLLILGIFFWYTFATTTYLSNTENGKKYQVMKVVLDGKSKIVVGVAQNYTPALSLKTLMENMWGTHAINWWFFCPDEAAYSRCKRWTSDLIRISNWTLYAAWWKHIWPYRAVFGFNAEWTVLPLATNDDKYYANNKRENKNLDHMTNGLMMPMLVKNGINVAVLFDEMNNDWKQGKAWNKTFICSTEDNSTIYMWYVNWVTFSSIADYIIKTFWCYNAILLDNGGTKAMIHNNKYIAGPWRAMRDAFIVIEGNNVWAIVTPTPPKATNNEDLETVIKWMYNQWLTMYDNIDQFLPNNTMTREEASKFYWVFAQKIYNKKENSTKKCNFSDIKKADPTLRNNITNSCKLWIFQWYKNKFTPLQKLNNTEAITVLMRVIEGMKEEPKNKYYTNYFLKATEYGLINNINANNPITRWEAAMLIYKAYQHKNNISNTWNLTENIKPTIACASSEHDAWWYCVSNTQTCNIYKWIGTQVWNGSSRWNCSIYSCNSWYIEQNGSCVAHTTSCNTNEHLENNSCINNSRSCVISNGIGVQTWNNTRDSCTVLSCNNDYHIQGNTCIKNIVIPTCTSSQHLENNICVSNTTGCTITNWSGQKMWNGSSRWTCTVTSCVSGYTQSWENCIPIPTCTEDNTCISNTTGCTITNWSGQKMWNGSSRWNCTVTSCASGYTQSWDILCILETS